MTMDAPEETAASEARAQASAHTAASAPMDALDRRANEVFGGRVVRKDLVRQVKVGANVPSFVLEFLLGKYCASDDPAAIATGLEVVRQTLSENFIRPDEAEKAKAALKRKGQHRLLDKVEVRLLASENKFWATLANFGDKFVHIPEDLVYRYERLLQGGVWCQVDLIYEAADDEVNQRPFYIRALKPIQVATFSMEEFRTGRAAFDRDQWLDLLVRSIGLEPSEYDTRGKLLAISRLVPMVERNYNLMELGPWGTGKSYVYRETSPNAILISGGRVTVAQLFINLGTGRVGLVGTWDVVAFDEVAGIEYSDFTVAQTLKDYMESGSFARGKDVIPAEASIVFLGNTSKPAQELVRSAHLFADLPRAMIDPAFFDRLHFYLLGWEVLKLEQRLFTAHYGFVSDYLAEALRELRKQSYANAIDREFALGSHLSARDERAVRKTVSAFLKLLHPDGEWTRGELREYLELALEGRRRVKEQLKKLAAHDYAKTSFSYIERDTGREYWVEVPEQPEQVTAELDAVTGPAESPSGDRGRREPLSTAELLATGESSSLEFKSSARWNMYTRQRDAAIELGVVKTVAGFLNARGGTLLVGVDDQRQVVGLDQDLKTFSSRQDLDAYENWLTNLFETSIGKPVIDHLAVRFEQFEGDTVCRIDVRSSKKPVFVNLGKGGADFYVRLNNSTRLLNTAEALDYIQAHWT